MNLKKFIAAQILALGALNLFAGDTTTVLQNGLNNYSGCADAYIEYASIGNGTSETGLLYYVKCAE